MPSDLNAILERALEAPPRKRRQILKALRDEAPRLNHGEADLANYTWPLWARDSQRPPPGDWAIWLVMAGRGLRQDSHRRRVDPRPRRIRRLRSRRPRSPARPPTRAT